MRRNPPSNRPAPPPGWEPPGSEPQGWETTGSETTRSETTRSETTGSETTPGREPPGRPGWRRSVLLLLGVAVGYVLLLAGMGLGLVTYLGHVQEDEYATAHAAYLRGDCDQALRHYARSLAARALDGQKALGIAVEQGACRQAGEVVAEARKADPGRAVQLYVEYLEYFADPRLKGPMQERLADLLRSVPTDQVVDTAVCSSAEVIEDAVAGSSPDPLPRFLLACGDANRDGDGSYRALPFYTKLETAYPRSRYGRVATRRVVQTQYPQIEDLSILRIPQPARVGTDRTLGNRVRLMVTLGSPEATSLRVTGPYTTRRALRPCPGCRRTALLGPRRCDSRAPRTPVVLRPGRYRALLDTKDSLQGHGSWTFRPGTVYSVCLVTFDLEAD